MSAPNRACLHLTNPTTWAWGTLAPTLTGNDNPQQLHLVSCCCPKVQPQPLLNLDLTDWSSTSKWQPVLTTCWSQKVWIYRHAAWGVLARVGRWSTHKQRFGRNKRSAAIPAVCLTNEALPYSPWVAIGRTSQCLQTCLSWKAARLGSLKTRYPLMPAVMPNPLCLRYPG